MAPTAPGLGPPLVIANGPLARADIYDIVASSRYYTLNFENIDASEPFK
jgi:hypothetical protein